MTSTAPLRAWVGPQRDAHFARSLVVISLLAVVMRVAYVVAVRHRTDLGFDAKWFHDVANLLADGRGFRNPISPNVGATAHRPPGYPGLLALASVFGGRSLLAHRLVGAFTGALSVAGIGLVGRQVGGERLGLRAAAIACVWPALIATDGSLMSETLGLPLVLAMLLATYRVRRDDRTRSFVLLGVAGAAAAYVRADAVLLFLLLVIVAAVGTDLPLRDAAQRAGAAVLVLLVLLAPWAVRNTLAFHHLTVTSTDLGGAVEGANCPPTYHGGFVGMWFLPCVTHPTPGENEAVGDQKSLRAGIHYARRHASRGAVVAGARLLRTWGVFPTGTQLRWESLETRWKPWQVAAWAVYLASLPFAVAGLVSLHRRRAPVAPLLACIVAVSVTSVLIYGLQRFRVDAEPALIIGLAAITARFPRERTFAPRRHLLRA